MTTVSKAYTATGNSEVMFVDDGQSYTYEVTGSFTATWIIETTRDQTNFTEVATGTGTQAAVTVKVNETQPTGGLWVRSRCDPFTSGTMTVVTADVADAVADTEIIDGEGLSVFKAVDGGIVMGGTSTTTGASTLTGNVAMAGTLAVTGVTTQTGQLNAGVLSCSGAATITGAATHTSTTALNDDVTIADAKNIVLNTTTGTKIGTATSQKLSVFNATPVIQANAATASASAITHTAPGTPDAAVQDLVSTAASFGFVTKDEGNTVLRNIVTMQTQIDELVTMVANFGISA